MRWGEFVTRWRERRRLDREARRLLDEMFEQPDLLAQGRLAPRHRHRLNVLEILTAEDGGIERLLLGIVRHPKPHPLAPRGDTVVELLEYRPRERTLRNVGSHKVRD